MIDPENFVARWSRLKREKVEDHEKADTDRLGSSPGAAPDTAAPIEPAAKGMPAGEPAEPAVDLASLPPIESITAGTDIRAFLQSGVPANLTKAALRRVWTTDPAIRDFIGLAENQWDFTDPTAMPGFGPLEATDDIGRLVSQAMGKLGDLSEPAGVEADASPAAEGAPASKSTRVPSHAYVPPQPAGMPEENDRGERGRDLEEGQHKKPVAAPQHAEATTENSTTPNRRAHGRALPR